LVRAAVWIALFGLTVWAFGALWFDFPIGSVRKAVAIGYGCAAIATFALVRQRALAQIFVAAGFVIVLAWWLTLRPSNNRAWKADVAQTGWAEIVGERVTLHNVRNCEYRSETDYTPRWETRTVDLAKLRGIDLAITYWGSKWIAHPIVSFQFEDALPVCFSIETRLEKGEKYSAIGGLYRRCELIYVCADERDVIRLRSNFRPGEDVYLYRTTAPAAAVRQRFLEYLLTLNALHAQPRWYNALTTNCTTTVRTQHSAAARQPWDWRILLNGFLDQLLYERGALAGGVPFPELKERAHINAAARAANDASDFSQRIRLGRPGFD
jgi:uncharacterized protein DUF4105